MKLTTIIIAALACAMLAPGRDAVWESDLRLTDNSFSEWCYWAEQRRVAAGPDGRVHAVWYVRAVPSDSFAVHYQRYNPGAGWSQDTIISADLATNQNKYPSVAVDSAGIVWVAWVSLNRATSAVYAKACLPEGGGNAGWDPASTLVSVAAPTAEKDCPTLAASPDGHLHAAWNESNTTVKYRERIAGEWQNELTVSTDTRYKVYPVIAAGRNNDLHIAYHGYFAAGNTYYNIACISRIAGAWQPAENVSAATRHQMYPNITVSPVTGRPHVVWRGYPHSGSGNQYRVIYAERTETGWAARETLSEYSSAISQGPPQLAVTPDGGVHVVWPGQSAAMPKAELIYRERDTAGSWLPYQLLTDTAGTREHPSICADSAGGLHVTWLDGRSSPAEMYYKYGGPGTGIAAQPAPGRPQPLFTLTPSPAGRGPVQLHCNLPAGTAATLVIFDPAGRTVAATSRLDVGPGALLALDGLPDGVYVVRLTAGGRSATRQLVVKR